MLRNVFGGCVSDRSADAMRYQKIKFGAPLSTTLKNNQLPIPLVELLRYIAAEGMNTADLFRRPGNPTDTRHVLKRLSEGKPVIYQNYNLYTLASVVKKFLLRLPDGIFGIDGEETLLQVLTLGHKMDQYKAVNDYINTLSQPHQQLVSLLFGIWFTMINNSDVNFMTTEALSRSVAGSIFHSCATDPAKVEKASRIMQILIENFGVASMFGQKNIEYFADVTHTKIHIREKFRYQFDYPADKMIPHCMLSPVGAAATKLFVLYLFQEAHDCCFDPVTDAVDEERFLEMTQLQTPREGVHEASESPDHTPDTCRKDFLSPHRDFDGDSTSSHLMAVSTISAPEVSLAPSPDVNNKRPKSVENNLNESSAESTQNKSLSRFNSVKRKQLERLRQRSDWFLRPSNSSTPMQLGSSYTHLSYEHDRLAPKISGNSVTKASSEGAALDILSSDDADSVFSNVSRSESPASEPIRTPPIKVTRDIIHSDPLGEATEEEDVPMEDDSTDHHHDVASGEDNLHDQEMHDAEICYFVVEHKYGDSQS